MGTIGDWSVDRLNNWMAERFNLQGNVRALISRAVADATVPSGVVDWTAAVAAPAGYLLCDGASYVRADYQALFDVIGTTYGAVDASHFNVPDLRGRVAVGVGTHADVNALTDNDGLAVGSRTPKHAHHKGVIRTGVALDYPLLVDPGLNAAGATDELTPWATAFKPHKHDLPAFDTDTAAGAYQALTPIIKF